MADRGTAIGQEIPFKLVLHSSHSPKPSRCWHTNLSPVRTIIRYADGLPESLLNKSISYFELPCFTITNMRTGGSVEKLLRRLHGRHSGGLAHGVLPKKEHQRWPSTL